jgi:hypothetical protein
MTEGQSASLSLCQISGAQDQKLYYCQTVKGLLMWGTLSDEWTDLSFTIAAGPRLRSHSRVRVPRYSLLYFCASDSRLPQPGGLGLRIYIPQEQGGPVTPPGVGFPFRRLLWQAGLRWRYSNPPPCGGLWLQQSQSYVTTDGQSATNTQSRSQNCVTTDGQSASLSWNKPHIWGLRQDFYYSVTVAGLLMWALSLTRVRFYRLQLLLALASVVILWSEFFGTRDHILLSEIWAFPFSRLLRLAGRYSIPHSHRVLKHNAQSTPYVASAGEA